MATINEDTGELTLTKPQRAALAKAMSVCRLLAKLGSKDADMAVQGLTPLVVKYPVTPAE